MQSHHPVYQLIFKMKYPLSTQILHFLCLCRPQVSVLHLTLAPNQNCTCLISVHLRKSKLRVFDLTDVHQDFWNPGAGTHEGDYLPQVERQKQSVEICPNSGVKKRFNVVTDLEIRKAKFKKCDKYVLQWVRRRKRSVHLCCRMLKILDSSVSTATLIFKKINLSCVLELWLSQWSLEFLAQLLPYLEKMRNLHTLALNGVWKPLGFAAATEQEWISMLLSQISKLHCLQNLSVYNVYFITGCLEEWLSLKSILLDTRRAAQACFLSPFDWKDFSQPFTVGLWIGLAFSWYPNLLDIFGLVFFD
ncbi:hypothetical protein STEG23_012909 [Scotinomys teguina]